jgi:hypothetical protein
MEAPENVIRHIDRIGMEEYLNCILVEKGVRPACMMQPPDYGEVSAADPITNEKLTAIREVFPELIQSVVSAGIIISKREYTNDDIPSDGDLGRILGYICANEFDTVIQNDATQSSVSYNMIVNFKEGTPFNSIQLFVDRCKDTRTRAAHEDQRAAVESVLKGDARVRGLIDSVVLEETISVPPTSILTKLVNRERLSALEKSEMMNYIYNLGFEGDILRYSFDEQNEFQRGVLVTLMTHYIHNPLEPFFPITRYPQYEESLHKTKEWEETLYAAIEGQRGGGRMKKRYSKTRKMRKSRKSN